MNPFLWLLWAIAAIVILFIAAAVIHFVIEKYRELPPKRGTHDSEQVSLGKAQHYNHTHWAMGPEGSEIISHQGDLLYPPANDGR